jgi:hypothetical protein
MKLTGGWGALLFMVVWLSAVAADSPGLQVQDTGGEPGQRKVIVTSPGVFRAAVWQASGGGIMEFYDLAADPEAKVNLAGSDRGLFEIGWHGAARKDPDPSQGDYKSGEQGSYGCRDWPSMGHQTLHAEGDLEVVEQSAARVRVRAKSVFTFWNHFVDKNMPVEATYTFYPSGRIVIQVRVRKMEREFKWSGEYGPHLFVPGHDQKPEADLGFVWSTPRQEKFDTAPRQAEELVLATSEKVETSLMLTIPEEEQVLFDRHMRHNGRSIGWDRVGYGSGGVVMEPGYDNTWACMIEVGTPGSTLAPRMKTAAEALPHALQYRRPAKLSGADVVTDDPGDLNRDGFNESEGCSVLRGPGPLGFTYEKGEGSGWAPAFKVLRWTGPAPEKVSVDGRDIPCVSALVDGRLVLQLLGTVEGEKAKVLVGR